MSAVTSLRCEGELIFGVTRRHASPQAQQKLLRENASAALMFLAYGATGAVPKAALSKVVLLLARLLRLLPSG